MLRLISLVLFCAVIAVAPSARAWTLPGVGGVDRTDKVCLEKYDGQRSYCTDQNPNATSIPNNVDVVVNLGEGHDMLVVSSASPGCSCTCAGGGTHGAFNYDGYSVTVTGDGGDDKIFGGNGHNIFYGDDVAKALLDLGAGTTDAGTDWLRGHNGVDELHECDGYGFVAGLGGGTDLLYGDDDDDDVCDSATTIMDGGSHDSGDRATRANGGDVFNFESVLATMTCLTACPPTTFPQ